MWVGSCHRKFGWDVETGTTLQAVTKRAGKSGLLT